METPKTILVADDHEASLVGLAELLSAEGFKVVTARDGQVALAEFQRAQPDLVLSDVKMPVLSGFEVCRHTKNNPETRLAKKRSPIMNTKNGCPVHHSRVHQTPTEAKSLHPVIARPGLAASGTTKPLRITRLQHARRAVPFSTTLISS